MNLGFQDYMIEHGIMSQLSAPGIPQQNGVSERRNRTMLDMVRLMMSFAQLPVILGICNGGCCIHSSKSVSETPYELWKGRKGSLHHFKIWECPAHVLLQNPKKLLKIKLTLIQIC